MLSQFREAVCGELGMELDALELSMGMSGDYETAVRLGLAVGRLRSQVEFGSTNIRVGSSIFGARDYANKPAEGG